MQGWNRAVRTISIGKLHDANGKNEEEMGQPGESGHNG